MYTYNDAQASDLGILILLVWYLLLPFYFIYFFTTAILKAPQMILMCSQDWEPEWGYRKQ